MGITTVLLAASLFAGQEPKVEVQKGWIIETRGYTHHLDSKPPEPPIQVDAIEGIYVDDLRAYIESLKKEKR
ncbi:MAG TPA: hypothetical protein VKS79_13275 [Gemmataceae bacterium]|nr:hypothetical protein [Gemmataceae bacterium]